MRELTDLVELCTVGYTSEFFVDTIRWSYPPLLNGLYTTIFPITLTKVISNKVRRTSVACGCLVFNNFLSIFLKIE